MLTVLLTLVLIGLALYLAETYIPMAEPIKLIIRVVVVLFLLIWLAGVFGIADLPTPRLR